MLLDGTARWNVHGRNCGGELVGLGIGVRRAGEGEERREVVGVGGWEEEEGSGVRRDEFKGFDDEQG